MDIESAITTPLFVPESIHLLKLLDYFRKEGLHIAMVVDELGNIQGLITLHDILEAIVGRLPTEDEPVEAEIILRDDGSWLMDGSVTVEDFRGTIGIEIRPDGQADRFHTLAGFVMLQLQRIPKTGDHFVWNGFSFEVVDMDGMKIDKVRFPAYLRLLKTGGMSLTCPISVNGPDGPMFSMQEPPKTNSTQIVSGIHVRSRGLNLEGTGRYDDVRK